MSDKDSLLMQLCTENVYNNNIFHLLGLNTTATPRQIRRRREDLESAHEMGDAAWEREFGHLLGNREVPTFDEVKDAFEHLEDPEYRIISEFFWMWPMDKDDKAIDDLISNDESLSNAFRIWQSAANQVDLFGKHTVALHNLAVLYHLYAIDAELQAINLKDAVPSDFHERMCDYWTKSFVCWEELADNDEFWEIFEARMRELDDPRLTSGFIRRFRCQFPIAFDNINARLAAKYAKCDKFAEAKRHVDYMLKTMSGLDDVEETLRILFGPTSKKIKSLIERCNQLVQENPQKGLEAANKIIDATVDDFNVIYGLFGCENPTSALHAAKHKLHKLQYDQTLSPTTAAMDNALREVKTQEALLSMRESLYDPVVKACFNYLVKYSDSTKDWGITIKWDEFLSKLAVSAKLREVINKDLVEIFKIRTNEMIEEYAKQVNDDASKGVWAVRQLITQSATTLPADVCKKYGSDSDLSFEIKNRVASACREFLVLYGNATKDWGTCIREINKFLSMVKDQEILNRLKNDLEVLRGNIKSKINPPMPKLDAAYAASLDHIEPASNAGGTDSSANILWVIGLMVAALIAIIFYKGSVDKEREEKTYIPTDAIVTSAEQWEHVSKKGGRVVSRTPFYKIQYKYRAAGQTFVDRARCDSLPKDVFTVYYNPKKPSQSILARSKSHDALLCMIAVLLCAIVFIPVNIVLFLRKRRKQGWWEKF